MKSNYWNIYGNEYNLEEFINNHPGGSLILENTRGVGDITALFESYHAFSNIEKYKVSLNKYILKKNAYENRYDFKNYNELLGLVKEKFPDNYSVKATFNFFLMITLELFIYFVNIYFLIINYFSLYFKIPLSISLGIIHISLMFNLLHDSSHYAIFKNAYLNTVISKITNCMNMWNNKIWNMHHIIGHHSHTGLYDDPDKELYNVNLYNIPELIIFPFVLMPGQHIGQCILYFLGYYNNTIRFNYDKLDYFMIFIMGYILYSIGIYCSICYLITLNFMYFINIFPNHSFYETKITNKYEGNDWLELQIRNSGNFFNNNIYWTKMFGGINYQIEHHLFPNISNVHLPEVSKIVRKYCNDKNIPYVNIDSFKGIFKSLFKYIIYKKNI